MAFSNDLIGSSLLPRYQQPSTTQQNDKTIRCRLSLAALGVLMASGTALANNLPTGGTISLGQGSITQPDSQQLHIQQQSSKLAIDWQRFNIGVDNKVTFQQPDAKSVALNRVIGSDGSKIMGQLQANGQVFLLNPNGVLFGKDAKVNVGSLVASTLGLTNSQLSQGKYRFSSNQQRPASVVNQGRLQADKGGSVVLLGGEVSNQGTITANQGAISLGAGKAATLALSDDGLIQLEVSEAALNAQVKNSYLLRANGGQVVLTARAQPGVLSEVVNNRGVIEARSLQQRQGKIVLSGGKHGQVTAGGTLDSSARSTGHGGEVVITGEQLRVSGLVDSSAYRNGQGGSIIVQGSDIQLNGALYSSAKGIGNGGTILIDSEQQRVSGWLDSSTYNRGNGGTITLKGNDIQFNGVIDNSAYQQGEGGTIQLQGQQLALAGSLKAIGGNQGGTILTQAPQLTVADSTYLDTRSRQGKSGWWRVESEGVTVQNRDASSTATLGGTWLSQQLGNTNITLHSGSQDLIVAEQINWHSNHALVLSSDNSLQLNADISVTGCNGQLAFHHGSDGDYFLNNDSKVTLSGINAEFALNGQQYQVIHDVAQLQAINDNLTGHYVLGNTIDASATKEWNKGQGFIPIGFASAADEQNKIFQGVFSGLGNTINQLTLNHSVDQQTAGGEYGYGLFGYSQGYLRNVGLQEIQILVAGQQKKSEISVGGLVGINSGEVKQVYSTGTVTYVATDQSFYGANTGGLVGKNHKEGSLSHSNSIVEVAGEYNVGGLIGYHSGTVNNSSASGAVSGDWRVGGLIGYNDGTVNNSTASGAVSGDSAVGGLIGDNYEGTVSYSSASGAVSGDGAVGGLIGNNYEGTVSYSSASGDVLGLEWGGWSAGGLIGYNKEGTVSYSLASGAVSGNEDVGGLIGDNYEGTVNYSSASGAVSGNRKVGGLIGENNQSDHKRGVNHSSASGDVLGNDWMSRDIGGLIGRNNEGIVNNSSASGAVSGSDYVGGLIGYNYFGTVTDSSASGAVSGNERVGGLIGTNYHCTVSYSSASGDVLGDEGSSYSVGGLIGDNSGTVNDSSASGAVSGGWYSVGGLIGDNSGTVNDSSASGAVSGNNEVGGLIGYNIGTVVDTSAIGAVSGSENVGGLIGKNYKGTVSASFASGAVTSTDSYNGYAGGLIGKNSGGVVQNSSASGQVTGRYVGGLIGVNKNSRMSHYEQRKWIDVLMTGKIANSVASGNVFGSVVSGGLVGINYGEITDSIAKGDVISSEVAGSLVGQNLREQLIVNEEEVTVIGTINSSTAEGLVNDNEGPMVGENKGIINL